ncbi:MAG: hypothetical protein ACOYOQ_02715 [Microthrixaceae bacterium]
MSISTLVLLALAGVWAVVLAPEIIKRSGSLRNGDSVTAFRNQLSSIGRHAGSGQRNPLGPAHHNVVELRDRRPAPVRPQVSPGVRRRRQEILGGLAAAAVLTLLCTVAFGGAFLWLHLLADALLVGYVVLLVRATNTATSRSLAPVVRTTPASIRPIDEPGLAITRVTPISSRRVAN